MKTNTKNPTTFLNRMIYLLEAMLILVFIMPAVVTAQSSPAPVNLGTANDFVILAKTGISTTGTTHITGDIGLSPAAATYVTGCGLTMHSSGTYSTSSLITGKVYAADYTSPTPTKLTTAIGDMQTAYTDAAGRSLPDYNELYTGNLTGHTLTHGLYKWGTGVTISAGGVTISGSANDVWIFQIAQNLTIANGVIVTLSGGALASNIFWQVAGQVTIGTTAAMKGIILCQTLIDMQTGATLSGRALAQTAVTLNANAVTKPETVTAVKNSLSVPQDFALFQNYPNPFNPTTTINYSLPRSGFVTIKIYDLLGAEIMTLLNEEMSTGNYSIKFDGSNISSGIYFYQLRGGSFVETKKFVLMK
ncbi:MAG: ice-binding family protein [Ignavibacteriales bacterium]|nr:ice-binding family protein [Ignavibacteriales bacterium]